MRKDTPMLRFWRKVDTSSECWEWTANKVQNGYGRFWLDGYKLAHRVAYEWMVGPIPEGLQIDHLCRNRACVNPDHLEPVTGLENQRRGNAARAGKRAGGNGVGGNREPMTECPNGHPYADENTHRTPKGIRKCRTCMRAKQIRKRERRKARSLGEAA